MDIQTFQQKINELDTPVVMDVWAPWCGPCKMIEPALHRLEAEYAGRVELLRINADESRELLPALGIYGIPTLLVFRGGQEVMRTTGAQSQASLARLFEAGLSGEKPQRPVGISSLDRLLRVALGLLVMWLTWNYQATPLFYLAGAAILFTAVYDRCPIWQAISARLRGSPGASR